MKRARAQGIPIAETPRHDEARRLLAYLRDGGEIEPILAKLLVEALAGFQVPVGPRPQALPEHLENVLDWVGRSESIRGRALRGLLRTASRIVRSRGPVREKEEGIFPRFSSGQGFA